VSEPKIEASAGMLRDIIIGVAARDKRAEDGIPTVKEDMPSDLAHDTSAGMLRDVRFGDAAVNKAVRANIPAPDQEGMVLGFTKEESAGMQRDTRLGVAKLDAMAEASTDMQRERTVGDCDLAAPSRPPEVTREASAGMQRDTKVGLRIPGLEQGMPSEAATCEDGNKFGKLAR